MQTAQDLKQYRRQLKEAMQEDFQRKALDNFVQAYRQGRAKAFSGLDLKELTSRISSNKDQSLSHLQELYQQFKTKAEEKGIQVHLAGNEQEANRIIADIARENSCQRIVKAKSMTAEETQLNEYLEKQDLEVIETDLGEWIIQLRHEGPTHMVMPAIHLSRDQVSQLFTQVTGQKQGTEIKDLVQVARRELRQRFATADMGITGANFALADSATLGLVTNEGNARLVTTLPRVHVALVGLDKLTPSLGQALTTLQALPKNATGQAISSYVTWISGRNECAAAPDGQKIMHVVFLDNGRQALAQDPVFSQALRCVRCGACANVCPIYRLVGGHKYGHIYIGAIGLILTYFYHGRTHARQLAKNCLNCQACREVCIAGIDLPRLIQEVQNVMQQEDQAPLHERSLTRILQNRKLFHGLLRSAKYAQKPVSRGQPYLRHLPHFLLKEHSYKKLPALAKRPFRDIFPKLASKSQAPQLRIALFSGCLQDFVYPEQLRAGLELIPTHKVEVNFPKAQGCCGLPLYMLGQKQGARQVAKHNLEAIDPAEYDYILTMCASCGSHLKENYPLLLQDVSGQQVKAQQFSEKIIDFSSFLKDILGWSTSPDTGKGTRVCYHAPCHLCRGLGVGKAPRSLLQEAGFKYLEHEEEESCCGLGGSYSLKFPEISSEILGKKLDLVESLGAELLVTDCPGCILQLRGGARARQSKLQVLHMAEALSGKRE
ncbi:MAG: L-lactate dehydrogenase (quinone) large subunit LdhH [Desulfohalobiaceae bacterium]